jgi:TetR/AcrR family transcriptional regulator, cholesterol catabolism regulator
MPRSRPYAIRNTSPGAAKRTPPPTPASLTKTQLARRQRIIHAGLSLMLSNDYEDVQVRDVAETAGVALGTVYRYFSSKDHLFTAVFLAWQATLGDRLATRPPEGNDNQARLTDLATRAIRAFERQPTFYQLMVMTGRTLDPYAREVAEAVRKNSEMIFAEPLSGVSDEDRGIIVLVIGSVLEAALGEWLAGARTIEEVYQGMTRVITLLRLPS